MNKVFRFNTYWTMTAVVEVEAETEEEARRKLIYDSPLPANGTYLEDSFDVAPFDEEDKE